MLNVILIMERNPLSISLLLLATVSHFICINMHQLFDLSLKQRRGKPLLPAPCLLTDAIPPVNAHVIPRVWPYPLTKQCHFGVH